jgi:plastocyanin
MTTSQHRPSHPRSARSAVLLMAVSWLLAACGASVSAPVAPGPTAAVPTSPETSAAVSAATLAPSATPARAAVAPPTAQSPTTPAGATAVPAATSAAPAGASTVAVSIVEPPFKPPQEWHYDPAALTVNMGATITWTNTGAVLHTVTADDGSTFDSGNLNPKATFTFTPKQASTIAYHCTLHPWMKGTIAVQP